MFNVLNTVTDTENAINGNMITRRSSNSRYSGNTSPTITMKKYMAVWGALFFCVICLSLYLMLETLNTSPGRYNEIDEQSLLQFERKLDDIQLDIKNNQAVIDQIKHAVKDVSQGDQESIDKLQEILNQQNSNLKETKERVNSMQKGHNLDHREDNLNRGQEVGQRDRNVVNMEKPKPRTDTPKTELVAQPAIHDVIRYDPDAWKSSFVSLRKSVTISDDTCQWTKQPPKLPTIQMEKVMHDLEFDNPDGGAWKQGWPVTYEQNRWNAKNKLKVFVVPHSHNDPGWVKTYENYYRDQVRHILDNMLVKLEKYPKLKFMYAEISFFHIWWNEIDADKRQRVKKLVEEKRFEIITGGWVMNDEANTHYFAMLDQLLEGHQWLDGTLGVKPSAGWAIDPFGHTPTMAYLLRRSGFNNMLIQRVHYAIKKHLAQSSNLEFMWRQTWDHEGNTDMLCHMMPFYSYDVPHTCGPEPAICCQFDFRRLPGSSYSCPWRIPPKAISADNVAERAGMIIDQWKKKATLYKSNNVFAPLGDDFRYDKSDEWDLQYTNYQKIFDYLQNHPELGVEAQFGTLSDYFNSIYAEYSLKPGQQPTNFPSLSGDFYTYADKDDHYWSGYFTSRPFQKNLDRVMESSLRGAEIIFTLASTLARRQGHKHFPSSRFMDKLIEARRNLGLFQHHDGITGTAKDFVVVDYGNRLLSSLQATKEVIKECATYLTLDTKADYELSEDTPIFNVDDTRENHDSLPEKSVIFVGEVNDPPKPVLLYNTLGSGREQVVKIYVNAPHVLVRDNHGRPILAQIEPYWSQADKILTQKYKVSFRVTIPGLGIVKYTVQRVTENTAGRSVPVNVMVLNSKKDEKIEGFPFNVQQTSMSEVTLENPYLKATFAGTNGLLKSVYTKEDQSSHNTKLEFVTYGTKSTHGDKSGAYLFLPDGTAKVMPSNSPIIHVIQGPIVSEIHVYFSLVTHIVRLYNSSGVDGISLDMQNIVDITSRHNVEVAVRISTDVDNTDRQFYTDLNGFQMQKHRYYEKLTLQGNFYPMPTMAYIEDKKHRFTVLSANSLGFANLKVGVMEVMLDRRLNQDDSRGLGQGVTDSKLTPSRFKLLIENRGPGTYKPDAPTSFPSLLAHQTSLQLIHQVSVIPANSGYLSSKFPQLSDFTPMHTEMPCDVHFLNLRTMQNADDGKDRIVPRNTAALFLHRLGHDCAFPNKGLACKNANGEVTLSTMFTEVQTNIAQQVSLTLMYTEEDIDSTAVLDLDPMEIGSYVVTMQ